MATKDAVVNACFARLHISRAQGFDFIPVEGASQYQPVEVSRLEHFERTKEAKAPLPVGLLISTSFNGSDESDVANRRLR